MSIYIKYPYLMIIYILATQFYHEVQGFWVLGFLSL